VNFYNVTIVLNNFNKIFKKKTCVKILCVWDKSCLAVIQLLNWQVYVIKLSALDVKYLFGLCSMILQIFSYVVPASDNLLS
jgi:hypothetical protein